jgi:PTH2 family peptidyl-tRNA hydrolase
VQPLTTTPENAYKQVIVVRKDLNMRKGKLAAQVAHASMAAVFGRQTAQISQSGDQATIAWTLDEKQLAWFQDLSTKIVVGVADEAGLLALYQQARDAGLPCSLIQDRGFTEFGGVATYTTVGIGPADQAQINAITGALPLM